MGFPVSNQSYVRPFSSANSVSSTNSGASSQTSNTSSSTVSNTLSQIFSSFANGTSASNRAPNSAGAPTQKTADNDAQEASAIGSTIGGVIGSIFPGIGTAVGSFVGGILGGLTTMFGGKHKDQKARDEMRAGLQQLGLIDGEYMLRLADGSGYDIGKDGGFKLTNTDGTERRAYETDSTNPLTAQAIGWVNPLATLIAGGNEKIRTDLAGYLTNAATSNAQTLEDVQANVLTFYVQLGITPENAAQVLEQIAQSGAVGQDVIPAYAYGLQTLFTPPASLTGEAGASTTSQASPTTSARPREESSTEAQTEL